MWVSDFFRDGSHGLSGAFRATGRLSVLALAPAQRWRRGRDKAQGLRFRSPTRDSQTDAARMQAVKAVLLHTLLMLEREEGGLRSRLEEISARTALLMGNEDGTFFEREPSDEKALVEVEAEMMGAYRRLKALRSQIKVFSRLLALLGSDADSIEVIEQRLCAPAPPL